MEINTYMDLQAYIDCHWTNFDIFWTGDNRNRIAATESQTVLTLVLLNPGIPASANSVDPDQLASEEVNWSGSALFAIMYVNL